MVANYRKQLSASTNNQITISMEEKRDRQLFLPVELDAELKKFILS